MVAVFFQHLEDIVSLLTNPYGHFYNTSPLLQINGFERKSVFDFNYGNYFIVHISCEEYKGWQAGKYSRQLADYWPETMVRPFLCCPPNWPGSKTGFSAKDSDWSANETIPLVKNQGFQFQLVKL